MAAPQNRDMTARMTASVTNTPPGTLSPLTRAALWMCVSLLSFSAIAIAGREGGRVLTTNELIFWRSVLGVIVLAGVYWSQGGGLSAIASPLMPLHVVRSLIHFSAQYAWLYAVTQIPLTELFALEFTGPLWVAVLAPIFLGERLTLARIGAAALGFAGALLVAEAGLLTGHLQLAPSIGTLAAAGSAVGFACSMLLTKRLTRQDPALRILFWMQVLQALIAAALMLGTVWKTGIWPKSWSAGTPLAIWGWVAVLGIAGLGAHFALTRAFALADAIIVAPMDFLRLPLIAVVGALAYGESLFVNVAIGAAIVVAANGLNMWAERRAQQRRVK
jgi:drug/metabolite transporter (DMT)-like permease